MNHIMTLPGKMKMPSPVLAMETALPPSCSMYVFSTAQIQVIMCLHFEHTFASCKKNLNAFGLIYTTFGSCLCARCFGSRKCVFCRPTIVISLIAICTRCKQLMILPMLSRRVNHLRHTFLQYKSRSSLLPDQSCGCGYARLDSYSKCLTKLRNAFWFSIYMS